MVENVNGQTIITHETWLTHQVVTISANRTGRKQTPTNKIKLTVNLSVTEKKIINSPIVIGLCLDECPICAAKGS